MSVRRSYKISRGRISGFDTELKNSGILTLTNILTTRRTQKVQSIPDPTWTPLELHHPVFSSALELERYWCAFCVKSPSWNASSLFCCCTFCRRTCWLAPRNLPAFTFSFCIFALIDPAHDIFHTASFSAMCCYLNFLADFCWSVSSSQLNWLILFRKCTGSGFHSICACTKSDEKYVLQWLYACALCASRYLHLQKENLIPLFLHSMSDIFLIRIYIDARVF